MLVFKPGDRVIRPWPREYIDHFTIKIIDVANRHWLKESAIFYEEQEFVPFTELTALIYGVPFVSNK